MKNIALLIVALSLVMAGCRKSGDSAAEENKVPVQVRKVALGSVRQTLSYTGDVRAEVEVKLFSKTPDRIEVFYFDEGDRVNKGDEIGRIAASSIVQGLKQAEAGQAAAQAQMANVKAEYHRAKRLFEEDAMSQQQFETVETLYESASAQLAQAQAALESARSMDAEARLTAPISGVIGKRHYDAGDMTNMAVPVVTVVRMKRVKVVFDAAEQDLGKLKVGQDASVIVQAYGDRVFEGRILKISPILDPMTRMATVEVLIDNDDTMLKPGMFATVEITIGLLENRIVVPRYAVLESSTLKRVDGADQVSKNYFVYVLDDSMRAEQRQLQPDYINHNVLAVSDGVKIGEQIVVSGQFNLREGMPLLVVEEEVD